MAKDQRNAIIKWCAPPNTNTQIHKVRSTCCCMHMHNAHVPCLHTVTFIHIIMTLGHYYYYHTHNMPTLHICASVCVWLGGYAHLHITQTHIVDGENSFQPFRVRLTLQVCTSVDWLLIAVFIYWVSWKCRTNMSETFPPIWSHTHTRSLKHDIDKSIFVEHTKYIS